MYRVVTLHRSCLSRALSVGIFSRPAECEWNNVIVFFILNCHVITVKNYIDFNNFITKYHQIICIIGCVSLKKIVYLE